MYICVGVTSSVRTRLNGDVLLVCRASNFFRGWRTSETSKYHDDDKPATTIKGLGFSKKYFVKKLLKPFVRSSCTWTSRSPVVVVALIFVLKFVVVAVIFRVCCCDCCRCRYFSSLLLCFLFLLSLFFELVVVVVVVVVVAAYFFVRVCCSEQRSKRSSAIWESKAR